MMYDSYGRYIGYPVWIVTFMGHEFEKDSKSDVDKFVAGIEAKYAARGLSAAGKYTVREEWHSGF